MDFQDGIPIEKLSTPLSSDISIWQAIADDAVRRSDNLIFVRGDLSLLT
jgi:hypothetical protein